MDATPRQAAEKETARPGAPPASLPQGGGRGPRDEPTCLRRGAGGGAGPHGPSGRAERVRGGCLLTPLVRGLPGPLRSTISGPGAVAATATAAAAAAVGFTVPASTQVRPVSCRVSLGLRRRTLRTARSRTLGRRAA